MSMVACETCGKLFDIDERDRYDLFTADNMPFCSQRCADEYCQRTCRNCGTTYNIYLDNKDTKINLHRFLPYGFCSENCENEYHRKYQSSNDWNESDDNLSDLENRVSNLESNNTDNKIIAELKKRIETLEKNSVSSQNSMNAMIVEILKKNHYTVQHEEIEVNIKFYDYDRFTVNCKSDACRYRVRGVWKLNNDETITLMPSYNFFVVKKTDDEKVLKDVEEKIMSFLYGSFDISQSNLPKTLSLKSDKVDLKFSIIQI